MIMQISDPELFFFKGFCRNIVWLIWSIQVKLVKSRLQVKWNWQEPLGLSLVGRSQIFKTLWYLVAAFVIEHSNSTAFKLRNDLTLNARHQKIGVVMSLSPREIFRVKNPSPYVFDTKLTHKVLFHGNGSYM